MRRIVGIPRSRTSQRHVVADLRTWLAVLVNDLLHATREELLSISNFGEKTLEEVYKSLEGIGFFRRGREPVAV